MLLEVAMTGLPLVGSAVGGTGEVLRPGLAQALPPEATPQTWAEAIRTVLDDPNTARAQATELRKVLQAERTAEAHAAALLAGMED
jgi:glycosyltransferase involved in cell wall biosynthesis